MSCCHYVIEPGNEAAFTIDASRITFGRGCIAEVGERATALGMRRVAFFTDARLKNTNLVADAIGSLARAGLDTVVYDEVSIEPTDLSFQHAARFASETKPDGYVSVGGGSVIDTCKAANLYATFPAPFASYVNAPAGEGRAVPGPLTPHIACPTTSGTGSEVTGIAVFDWASLHAKTGIASARLRPNEALVDPNATATLPAEVVAASGLDVLCHALESFTARPFTARRKPSPVLARPMSQGANPWSDIGCREALSLLGTYLRRAVRSAEDAEARENVMWAATLAGIAFGNAGVHVPHAMGYAVAGLAHETGYRPSGYPASEPLVPHGISVAVNAPAVFARAGFIASDKLLDAARTLGFAESADVADGAEVLRKILVDLLRDVGVPNGLREIGYAEAHVPRLVEGTLPQARLLSNAPSEASADVLGELFRASLSYW